VGVSLFTRHGSITLTDARQETFAQEPLGELPIPSEARLTEVVKRIRRLLERHEIRAKKLSGIGLAVSGISDPVKGRIISSPDFPQDRDFELCSPISQALGSPCQLMNIPHLLAVMEHRWGHAKGLSDFLYLHSQGFGLGMFLRGALYRGARNWAGELGEIQIRAHQEGDLTRRTGTLGTVAPLYRVTDRLKALMEQGGAPLVGRTFKPGSKQVTLEMVTAAIEAGDQHSAQLLSENFLVIGETALSLAFLLNPQAIFLDPFTARIPQVTLDVVRRLVSHYGPRDWSVQVQILPAACGEEQLSRGAALLPAAARLGFNWDHPHGPLTRS
jgi:glucokinase